MESNTYTQAVAALQCLREIEIGIQDNQLKSIDQLRLTINSRQWELELWV